MTTQDVLELHRAGWSRDEILMLMQADRQQASQKAALQQEQQEPQQQEQQEPQQVSQTAAPQQEQQEPQQVSQTAAPQQESETVQLLREMLGMIRGNNINTLAGETRAVDAAEILAANDYGYDKGGKN